MSNSHQESGTDSEKPEDRAGFSGEVGFEAVKVGFLPPGSPMRSVGCRQPVQQILGAGGGIGVGGEGHRQPQSGRARQYVRGEDGLRTAPDVTAQVQLHGVSPAADVLDLSQSGGNERDQSVDEPVETLLRRTGHLECPASLAGTERRIARRLPGERGSDAQLGGDVLRFQVPPGDEQGGSGGVP
jgi:hypothetical protein